MARTFCRLLTAVTLCLPVSLVAAKKPRAIDPPAPVDRSRELQPLEESLDLDMYQRIRDEGLNHSHVMEFASALADGIGPRLTGSPNLIKANEWALDTLRKIGLENAHPEDWGEFGMGWQQLNTWVRLVSPDTAVLIVQAAPWSPPTPGPITVDVVPVNIETEKDLDRYRGKLAGKFVLDGPIRAVPPVNKPLFERHTDKGLKDLETPVNWAEEEKQLNELLSGIFERNEMAARFFAEEKVAAVIEPSRDGDNGGGSRGNVL